MTKIEDDVFSDLFDDGSPGGGFALLVDSGGPVIAGSLSGHGAAEAAAQIATASLDVTKDAVRAAQHLGFGEWSAVVCEAEGGAIAFARVAGDATAVVGARAPATPGSVRRLLGRVVARGESITVRV